MALPVGIQARYIHLTKRMLIHGANFEMPHTKPMKDGLFELRMKSKKGIERAFYYIFSEQINCDVALFHKENSENTIG